MTNPNPFEHLFDQIADLVDFTKNHKEKGISGAPLDESIEEQIEQLEAQVVLFQKATEQAMKRCGLSETEVDNVVNNPGDELGQREKKILLKTGRLMADLETIESEYARMSRVVILQKKKAKTQGKKRAKKFKRLGGQGWMPM